MTEILLLQKLDATRFETPTILKKWPKPAARWLNSKASPHPYTKIEYVERDLNVSRLTATKYLDALTAGGFLKKQKIGRTNYYINIALNRILMGKNMGAEA